MGHLQHMPGKKQNTLLSSHYKWSSKLGML
jgi:hypothetical protein